jgi:putative redox protein
MRTVDVKTAGGKLAQTVTVGPHVLPAGEATTDGGDDSGPSPHEYLLAALGTCTSMTLELYAARKAWDLQRVHVHLTGHQEADAFVIERTLHLEGGLSEEQRGRLAEIADKCPIARVLRGKTDIRTILV